MFMQKVYRWSISIGVLGITLKLIERQTVEAEPVLSYVSSGMVIFGVVVYCLIQFLSGFAPIYTEPKWELVYPELALGDESAPLDMDSLRENKDKVLKEMRSEIVHLRSELDELKKKINPTEQQ